MDLQLCEPATEGALDANPEYVAERKLDGVRALADEGRILTRSGRDVTHHFPEIDPPEHHVLDGEIITTDFAFESALRRVQTEDRFKVDLLADQLPARLVAFDVLEVNGGDVRDEPLTERKELLEASIPSDAGIVPVTVHDDARALWEQAQTEGWEGIILKDPTAPYRGDRTDEWLKLKDWNEGTYPVVDTERTENGGFVVYLDVGDDEPQRVVVNGQLDQADVRDASEVEVQYLETTDDGRLRKPSFRGVADA